MDYMKNADGYCLHPRFSCLKETASRGSSDSFFLLLKIHTLLNFPAEGFCYGGEYYFSIHNI